MFVCLDFSQPQNFLLLLIWPELEKFDLFLDSQAFNACTTHLKLRNAALFHVPIKNTQNKHKAHIVRIMSQMEKLMCYNDIRFATSKAAEILNTI